MNILTFWSPIPSNLTPEIDLLKLWTSVWQSHGWSPKVLSYHDAIHHPKFTALLAKIDLLPTVNDKFYEHLCYIRWLAFSLAGGGTICDYDVFPSKPFPPRPWNRFTSASPSDGGFFTASPSDIESFIDSIINYQLTDQDIAYDKPHCSDVNIMFHTRPFFCLEPILALHNDPHIPNWRDFPLIHFSNRFSGPNRADIVKQTLGL